ncbi:MAG: YfiR family protein [Deltaproteobacteria bacterium]|nr:YfiR family protein [Deltaproteobacteria bacterium]MBN2673183.1 YfiR family protein [Deltaproteobacteria bacterium]
MRQLKPTITAAILLTLLCSLFSSISNAQVQAKLQAAIFVKLLNYDTKLAEKKQKSIKFHIVLDGKTANQKDELKAEFGVISRQKIAGKSVLVVVTDIKSLASATSADTAHIYYLPDGTAGGTLSTTLKLAKQQQIPVLAGNESLATDGAAVGITIANKKPQIIVNLKQSKALGMALSSQLLKLAKVI